MSRRDKNEHNGKHLKFRCGGQQAATPDNHNQTGQTPFP